MDIRISRTGYGRGWGKDIWKECHGLTRAEIAHCRAGGIVIITDCPPSGGGNRTGTTLRQIKPFGRRFYHIVPTPEVIAEAERLIQAAHQEV